MKPQSPIKPRVLVVDDTPANRVAFQSLLEGDYTVRVAESGYRALELALSEDFAVILLDVRMSGLDGFETAELLRKRESMRHTPIIFMSAFDQTAVQAKRGYVAGATDFLFSPVDEDLMKFKVAAYVQIFLRQEAMKIQIQQLTNLVQSLHVEILKRGPAEQALKEHVRELEVALGCLKREMSAVPS